eukprot:SAG25_NODE_309_length_10042_cov_25.194609_13_plen_49_part_00
MRVAVRELQMGRPLTPAERQSLVVSADRMGSEEMQHVLADAAVRHSFS